jgi:hypothetical protein
MSFGSQNNSNTFPTHVLKLFFLGDVICFLSTDAVCGVCEVMTLHFIASGDVSVELLVREPDWHYLLKGHIFPTVTKCTVILGGVMLIMLSIGPKVHDLNPAEGDQFLRVM